MKISPTKSEPTVLAKSAFQSRWTFSPQKLVISLSVLLIVGGILLIFQPWFFKLYQIGFVCLMIGAFLQIVLGNTPNSASYVDVLKIFVTGSCVFVIVVCLAIWLAPKLTGLL